MELGASRSDQLSDQLLGGRFQAFVSYSHADKKVAQKLHRKIETYRLPKHLRDLDDDGREVTGRIGRVFRDREDLPAAQDLSEAVKQALEVSEALIVLCSPDAKASPWVAKEIELFRKLHPDGPVLAAIVRGEPDEAFPSPLMQGKEPLAADLRKEGDGWRLGFLKVIAGIADVPLDALVQRDAQRRLRSVTAVTGGALAALLAMIGMTIFAFQQRNEALYQQAQAEGLVDYMLTDLRDELKGVGRLDVMTDVNERAMDYYEAQDDLSDMPAESLERRARILHAWGEDDEKRGDLDKALAKFEEAHRTTQALLAHDPENPDRIFGHAQSEYWVGRVHELNRNWEAARECYSSYSSAAQLLNKMQPTNEKYFMEVAWGYLNLGILRVQERAATPYGENEFLRAIDWMKKAEKLKPSDQGIAKEIGNAYAWLADSRLLANKKKASLSARKSELDWRESYLELDPKNMDAKYGVSKALYSVAHNQALLGKQDVALSILEKSQREMDEMLELDPTNEAWRETMDRMDKLKRRISNVN